MKSRGDRIDELVAREGVRAGEGPGPTVSGRVEQHRCRRLSDVAGVDEVDSGRAEGQWHGAVGAD